MKILSNIYRKTLKIFGDIKVFPWPMFILYHPEGYGVKGEDVRKIIKLTKPGDILVRGYKRYLDGYFIPGFFSHAGIAVQEGMVIHSIAEGVFKEDLINFCRCDFMAVLRFQKGKVTEGDKYQACVKAEKMIGSSYDFEFESGDKEYYCTEMVYEAWRPHLEIEPMEIKALGGLIKKKSFMPDQFWKHVDLNAVFFTEYVSDNFV